jgi:hypothetical protein
MDLKTHVKSVIEHMTCSIHHQRPLLGIADNGMKLDCCCGDFNRICFNMILKVLLDHKDQELSGTWEECNVVI